MELPNKTVFVVIGAKRTEVKALAVFTTKVQADNFSRSISEREWSLVEVTEHEILETSPIP